MHATSTCIPPTPGKRFTTQTTMLYALSPVARRTNVLRDATTPRRAESLTPRIEAKYSRTREKVVYEHLCIRNLATVRSSLSVKSKNLLCDVRPGTHEHHTFDGAMVMGAPSHTKAYVGTRARCPGTSTPAVLAASNACMITDCCDVRNIAREMAAVGGFEPQLTRRSRGLHIV